jgi:hypothetical protein
MATATSPNSNTTAKWRRLSYRMLALPSIVLAIVASLFIRAGGWFGLLFVVFLALAFWAAVALFGLIANQLRRNKAKRSPSINKGVRVVALVEDLHAIAQFRTPAGNASDSRGQWRTGTLKLEPSGLSWTPSSTMAKGESAVFIPSSEIDHLEYGRAFPVAVQINFLECVLRNGQSVTFGSNGPKSLRAYIEQRAADVR